MAHANRKQLLRGIDPLEARDAERAQVRATAARSVTFRECAEKYIADRESTWRNDVHRRQWRSTLGSYVYPTIGELSVAAVDVGLVLRCVEPIWTTMPETAGRVRGRIEAVLDWAGTRGYRDRDNPARWKGHLDKVLPPRGKQARVRHHPALPFAEIPSFMATLRKRDDVAARLPPVRRPRRRLQAR